MYPEAFRPNSFRKTKIYHVDLIHSEIPQTYCITQTNYAIKTKEHFHLTYQYLFSTRINVKSEK